MPKLKCPRVISAIDNCMSIQAMARGDMENYYVCSGLLMWVLITQVEYFIELYIVYFFNAVCNLAISIKVIFMIYKPIRTSPAHHKAFWWPILHNK